MESIPGMAEFLDEFTSEAAMGEDGYLLDKGLIPLSDSERAMLRKNVMAGKAMSM
jgi:phosphate transport system substrate-binding protein